jgi:hypothetical protein
MFWFCSIAQHLRRVARALYDAIIISVTIIYYYQQRPSITATSIGRRSDEDEERGVADETLPPIISEAKK